MTRRTAHYAVGAMRPARQISHGGNRYVACAGSLALGVAAMTVPANGFAQDAGGFIRPSGTSSTTTTNYAGTPGVTRGADAGIPQGQRFELRERLLGWNSARASAVYVESAPSGVAGFAHVSIVETGRDIGSERRIRLTTDTDASNYRTATDRDAARRSLEQRVERDIASAANGLQPGSIVPMSPRAPVTNCMRPPFVTCEFDSAGGGGGPSARVTPSADGRTASVHLAEGGRAGPASVVPSMIVTSGGVTTAAPYNRVMDLRQIPGADVYVALLGSDACTPEGVRVAARAVLLTPPPPPERELATLVHAELYEPQVMRALSPRARRTRVDEVSGYFEGRTRVVFDNAWAIPGAVDRVLVQYTRQDPSLPPDTIDRGQANTSFAVFEQLGGSRSRLLSTLTPPLSEEVFEGVGQEAYSVDLDGDGRSEIVVRARTRAGNETLAVLAYGSDHVQLAWRAVVVSDNRELARSSGQAAEVRRCRVGEHNRDLVLRCAIERFAPGAPPGAQPASRATLVQRMRWNGGSATVTTEAR